MLSGGGRNYTWNVENKPTAITGPDGVTEGYNYDADGEQVSRSRSGTITYYFGGMWEEDSTGTIRAMYSFGGKIVATRQRVSGVDTVSYLQGDHLGSVSLATSSSGAVANQQEFDPWGKVRLGGMSQTTLNYTAQRLDGTGLLYYHARMYDPGLGKFVSADSIVPNPGNLQSFNKYSYGNNSPLNRIDPTGHCDRAAADFDNCQIVANTAITRLGTRVSDPNEFINSALWTIARLHTFLDWLNRGVQFVNEGISVNTDHGVETYTRAAQWNTAEIGDVVDGLNRYQDYLKAVSFNQEQIDRALGTSTLRFNKFTDSRGRDFAGYYFPENNTVNLSFGGDRGRVNFLDEMVLHEIGHRVDHQALVYGGGGRPGVECSDLTRPQTNQFRVEYKE